MLSFPVPPIDDINVLPPDLPVPVDDGAADHLRGMRLPSVELRATSGRTLNLAELPGISVVYCYPRTGQAGQEPPPGWNEVPGARGCTPQSCGYRDLHRELIEAGARVFGLSTESTEYQREAAQRLHLPFELLRDEDLKLTQAIGLPTFVFEGVTLTKRITLIVEDGRIAHLFYPVFPPDRDAGQVLSWLRREPGVA
jgi:peroxiredoxin